MKYSKNILFLSLLAFVPALMASASDVSLASGSDCCSNKRSRNFWQPRAFSSYSLSNALLLKDILVYEDEPGKGELDMHHYFGDVNEYMHNFSNDCNGLGSTPFWSGTNKMTVGNNDGTSDLDGYQFGMGEVIEAGSIALNPIVQQFGSELFYYYQNKKRGASFVAKLYLPIGMMKTQAQLCEEAPVLDSSWCPESTPNCPESVLYPAGPNINTTMKEAFNTGTNYGVGPALSTALNLNHISALEYGKISCCPLTKVGCADLSVVLGCNVVNEEKGFCMVGVKATLPTGNVPTAEYIFEPIFGRGGYWGLGLELSGACKSCEWGSNKFDFYVQGEVLHLGTGRKPAWRSFDLKQNGVGSKYLLVSYVTQLNNGGDVSPEIVPSVVTPAINITTMPVISSYPVEGSLAVLMNVTRCDNWSVGLGAEVWGRTKENLSIDTCNVANNKQVNLNDFAVLGRQLVPITLTDITSNQIPSNTPYWLCEPLARINKSQDQVMSGTQSYDTALIKDARIASNRIPGDLEDALDICGAEQPRAVSGKVMVTVGYNWSDSAYNPNITLFGAAEFADKTMANFWSVGLKGSVNF